MHTNVGRCIAAIVHVQGIASRYVIRDVGGRAVTSEARTDGKPAALFDVLKADVDGPDRKVVLKTDGGRFLEATKNGEVRLTELAGEGADDGEDDLRSKAIKVEDGRGSFNFELEMVGGDGDRHVIKGQGGKCVGGGGRELKMVGCERKDAEFTFEDTRGGAWREADEDADTTKYVIDDDGKVTVIKRPGRRQRMREDLEAERLRMKEEAERQRTKEGLDAERLRMKEEVETELFRKILGSRMGKEEKSEESSASGGENSFSEETPSKARGPNPQTRAGVPAYQQPVYAPLYPAGGQYAAGSPQPGDYYTADGGVRQRKDRRKHRKGRPEGYLQAPPPGAQQMVPAGAQPMVPADGQAAVPAGGQRMDLLSKMLEQYQLESYIKHLAESREREGKRKPERRDGEKAGGPKSSLGDLAGTAMRMSPVGSAVGKLFG